MTNFLVDPNPLSILAIWSAQKINNIRFKPPNNIASILGNTLPLTYSISTIMTMFIIYIKANINQHK
jgi:hypothetical protein